MRGIDRFAVGLLMTLGCGSSSSPTSTNDPSDAQASQAATPATCADDATALCTRAGSCGTDGTARVAVSAGTAIKYATVTYCESIFTQQCGPQAPAGDVPLVRDPVACGQSVGTAACANGALLLPAACGGQ